MRLLLKFSLVFILVFGAGLTCAAYLTRNFLRTNAIDQAVHDAQLMMETALAMRTYTTAQIKPLLQREELRRKVFFAQTVPAYAATESFNYLHSKHPEYSYKEATLNPTNPRDRAVDWEADIIRTFRDHPEQRSFVGHRDTPTGVAWFMAQPIVAEQPCMECHTTAAKAPVKMVELYGPSNGFGWKLKEIVGAQIVSVPASVPIKAADQAFAQLLGAVSIAGLLTLLAIDLALLLIVVRPITKVSKLADRISTGEPGVPELPATGSDEISMLARSFNRMRLSLEKAIRMLDQG